MALCTVSGTVKDVSETAISGAIITAKLVTPIFSSTTQILPTEVSTTSASDGTWSLSLLRTASVNITIQYPPNSTNSKVILGFSAIIPNASTAEFSTIAVS
jgi:hypothetical protein